jgi:hypothetical protein
MILQGEFNKYDTQFLFHSELNVGAKLDQQSWHGRIPDRKRTAWCE